MSGILRVRQSFCRDCPTPCEGKDVFVADWNASCPIGRWGAVKQEPETVVIERPKPKRSGGPGTELKALLARFGIKAGACACNQRAAEMDRNGPDWCEANLDTIVSWLEVEALKRKLPFFHFIAKRLVQHAINKSRKCQTESNN